MVRDLNVTIFTGADEADDVLPWLYDFVWMSAARHVAISPSTFAWWSTLKGDPDCIYFLIMAGEVPMFWCRLLPLKAPSYTFVDWWANRTYAGGSEVEARRAQQVCDDHESVDVQTRIDRIKSYFPEFYGSGAITQ